MMAARFSRHGWIPWSFVAFFLMVFAANGVMIFIAVDTWTGVSTDDAYRKGLAYNRELAAARSQQDAGWQVGFSFTQIDARRGRIEVDLRDREGRPLEGAGLHANVRRPTHQGHDFVAELSALGDGGYGADIDLPLSGQWHIQVLVTHPDGTYQLDERILVRER